MVRLRCYRCGEPDYFAQECPNTPTDDEMGYRELPLNFEGEVEYLNL